MVYRFLEPAGYGAAHSPSPGRMTYPKLALTECRLNKSAEHQPWDVRTLSKVTAAHRKHRSALPWIELFQLRRPVPDIAGDDVQHLSLFLHDSPAGQ